MAFANRRWTNADGTPGEETTWFRVSAWGKLADWLFEEFGQQGHRFRAGQFRLLAEREDESGMIMVGKGTIKRMDYQNGDERGPGSNNRNNGGGRSSPTEKAAEKEEAAN